MNDKIKSKKTCVIFNFFDDNGKDKLRTRNLKFFIDIGVKDYQNIDCYIIDRNEDNIKLELPDNVRIIKYENVGICINGYKYGLNNIDIEKYDYFCLLLLLLFVLLLLFLFFCLFS